MTLKPCPFCGEPAEAINSLADDIFNSGNWARISCVNHDCGVKPYSVQSATRELQLLSSLKAAVAHRWNTRQEPTS